MTKAKTPEQKRFDAVHRTDERLDIADGQGDSTPGWKINASYQESEYYSDEWDRCHGEEVDARLVDSTLDFQPQWKCAGCDGGFVDSEMSDVEPRWEGASGKRPPPHFRRLTHEDVARKRLKAAIEALGLDPHDDSLMEAQWAVRDTESRRERTPLSMIAEGVHALSRTLDRRVAVEQTAAAIADMDKLKVGDEFIGFPSDVNDYYAEDRRDEDAPFFTEAFLYRLLGKEAARTVLAYFNRLKRSAGQ